MGELAILNFELYYIFYNENVPKLNLSASKF